MKSSNDEPLKPSEATSLEEYSRIFEGTTKPLATPLFTSSVYQIKDLDHLDELYEGKAIGYSYARDGHPNATYLAVKLNQLHQAPWGIICGSGMAALSLGFLTTLRRGDRILASRSLYGRTSTLLRQELPRLGIETIFADLSNGKELEKGLQQKPRMIFWETISNPLVQVIDIPKIVAKAKDQKILTFVDNTFATPNLVRPIDWGIDFVMESLTKILSGHGDVTLGYFAGKDKEILPFANQLCSVWGFSANPFDCWQAERGLETYAIRLQQASVSALWIAEQLQTLPVIENVFYPGLTGHPDHTIATKIFQNGFGSMMSFTLKNGNRQQVNQLFKHSPAISFSPSLGCLQTTFSYPWSTSHRYDSPAEKNRQNITENLIRLSIGIEPKEEIFSRLKEALSFIS